MTAPTVPPVPLVTIRATFECVYFPDPSTGPAEWWGWCEPGNPWGTADDSYDPDDPPGYGDDGGEPIERVMPVWEAAEFLADFPGAVWELGTECEASPNYRTGVYTRVTAHVDGPGAAAACELAAAMIGGRR